MSIENNKISTESPYYIILEVASTHGGNVDYVARLLDEFRSFTGVGIKFQPFKYDLLAAADYKGYYTYKKLYFDEKTWNKIIVAASETKEVWLDMFDDYSVEILTRNLALIKGIKIQASALGNLKLLQRLASIDLSAKACILNISGFVMEDVVRIVGDISAKLRCQIVIQAGYQSHPTEFADSGIVKIAQLRVLFPGHVLSFTDHLEHGSPDVLVLPLVTNLLGAKVIEKHVMCESLPTQYDHYSSITHRQFKELEGLLIRYNKLLGEPFIHDKEERYLKSSLLTPLLNKDKNAGQGLAGTDFDYKRTSKQGLDSFTIFRKVMNFMMLSKSLIAGSAIQETDLKKARIGAIIVCRMKSKRLPKKALLKIGKLSSIELCIKNTLQFENVDEYILATSDHPDDAILKDYTYSDKVKFFKGSEDDVIDRFLSAASLYQLDVIVRVTGDSPFRSNDVLQILLESHFDKGADYTAAKNAMLGTNIEVINVEALRRVHDLFNGAPYSEYMSYYFKNNPEFFTLNLVNLPPLFTGSHRLTLDYEEDLIFFRAIDQEFNYEKNPFDTVKLFDFLDKNPSISAINKHCEVAYAENTELMNRIIKETTYKLKKDPTN